MKIFLPLPDKKLSPNARVHHMALARAKKQARISSYCKTIANIARLGSTPIFNAYRLTFYFRDKRRRDDDNASASCKAYRDGIAEALGVDDHTLKHHGPPEMLVRPEKTGVEFELFTV